MHMARLPELHDRYRLQSTWTREIRRRLYERSGLKQAGLVLEVGSGTGVISAELATLRRGAVYGLDIDAAAVRFAQGGDPTCRYMIGDAFGLPFAPATFDVVLSHFLFLWLDKPAEALAEMVRVARPGAVVLALAEPDYGGRLDFPPQLEDVGRKQAESLRAQGANPHIGRALRALFARAGLRDVLAGVLGGEWGSGFSPEGFISEWDTLEDDLRDTVSPIELAAMRRVDEHAWRAGERLLYVPTFYAMGRVSGLEAA
jgi:ubiquinone/menaquinone biosynthesis C-methylase UbiE